MTTAHSPTTFPTREPRPGELSTRAVDRFLQQLNRSRDAHSEYREALRLIQDSTESDVVFVMTPEGVVDMVGAAGPSVKVCDALGRRFSGLFPQGGIWASDGCADVPPDEPVPAAVVVLPVLEPAQLVVCAVRFAPKPGYVKADLRLLKLVWRLQTDAKRQANALENLKETLFGVVRCLSTAIDAKDPYTCGHSERVARIAVRLGKQMGVSRGEVSDLYLAGLLHDVGKIGIRDDVLMKEGPLTAEEFRHIQEHPVIGERIIANVTRLAYLRPGVRGHHERFDGKGYPDGIAGEAIPLMARILAVADSCDAMMSTRRYRPELPRTKIEQIFREGAGSQWDPAIVEHFFACRHDLYAVCQRGLGQSVYMAVERAADGVRVEPDSGLA